VKPLGHGDLPVAIYCIVWVTSSKVVAHIILGLCSSITREGMFLEIDLIVVSLSMGGSDRRY
jgi:hypothetical protein